MTDLESPLHRGIFRSAPAHLPQQGKDRGKGFAGERNRRDMTMYEPVAASLGCRLRAFPVITDLAGGTLVAAGTAVGSVITEVYLAAVGECLVAIGIIRFAAGEDALPAGTQGSFCIGQEGLALSATGTAVVYIGIKVDAPVIAEGGPVAGTGRAAPAVHADLPVPAHTAADAAVLPVGEDVHAGIAARSLAARAGEIHHQRCRDTRRGRWCSSLRKSTLPVPADQPGRACVPAETAVCGIGQEVPARTAAGSLSGRAGGLRAGSGDCFIRSSGGSRCRFREHGTAELPVDAGLAEGNLKPASPAVVQVGFYINAGAAAEGEAFGAFAIDRRNTGTLPRGCS